jgi:hypothetical protein
VNGVSSTWTFSIVATVADEGYYTATVTYPLVGTPRDSLGKLTAVVGGFDPRKKFRKANVARVAPVALRPLSFGHLFEMAREEVLRPACAYIRAAAS